jgi:serine/threonine protein kinase
MLKVIGRGSFGKVYLVQKKDNDKLYAMKTLKKDGQLLAAQYASTKGKSIFRSFTARNSALHQVAEEARILLTIDCV